MNVSPVSSTCTLCGTPLDDVMLGGLCPRCVALDFFTPAPAGEILDQLPPLGEGEERVGDYELLEEISRGGMGVVYRARQVSLGREVAVKMLLHGVLAGDTAIARFKAEASAVANLRHPNIVAIHEIGEHRGRHFFSMEFVTGRTLAGKVRDGPLPPRLAANYLRAVAEAVHYAHEHGVLHRDLKPSNVLIDEHDQPRVTDFGLAKRAGAETELTMTGQIVGTPAYMSPEQAGGAKFGVVDARSDVYSLGAILYHLVTGSAPFTGEAITEILHQVIEIEPVTPRLLNPALPRNLETICLKALAKEPVARYAGAQALADDLGRFLRGDTIAARPARAPEKLWRWCRRRPALASALAACLAILVAGVAGILWQLKQTEAAREQAVQKAKDEAIQRHIADQARNQAEQSALTMRQNLYAADMMAAQRALAQNDLGTARLLVERHRPLAGQEDLRGFEWRYLWAHARGDMCVVLTNAAGAVNAIAFSPDGKWLAFAGQQVIVCDAATFQERARARVFAGALAFETNSSSLLLGAWDSSTIQRWDWRRNANPSNFIDPHGPWPRAALSPAGDVLAVSCGSGPSPVRPDGTTTLYDPLTRQPRRALPESGGHMAFSPDGKLLATGSWQDRIKLWNPATGQLMRELTNATMAQEMTFSPDGRMLAVCNMSSDAAWLFDLSTGEQRELARGTACDPWSAAFSPDGTTIATAVTDQTVRLWDVKSGAQTGLFLGHSYQVAVIAWSPDGKVVASGGTDGTVRLWDVAAARKDEITIPGTVQPGMFSQDGKLVTATGADGAVGIYELPSLRPAGTPHQMGTPLGFLPDATAFLSIRGATNGESSEVVWWSVPDFQALQKIELPRGESEISLHLLSPDRHLLVTADNPGNVRVWNLAGHGELLAQAAIGDGARTVDLAFSPDGRLLAVSQLTNGYLWDLRTVHSPVAVNGLRGRGVRFSKDGRILIGNNGNSLAFWDAASHKEIGGLIGRWGGVMGSDLSPDGKTLAIPTRMGIRLWSMDTRREVARYDAANVISVAFSPDGAEVLGTEHRAEGPVTLIRRAPGFEETDAPRGR